MPGSGGRTLATLDDLVSRVYDAAPTRTLFHYTSLQGLLGIVNNGGLWVSEARHMNDVAELASCRSNKMAGLR